MAREYTESRDTSGTGIAIALMAVITVCVGLVVYAGYAAWAWVTR